MVTAALSQFKQSDERIENLLAFYQYGTSGQPGRPILDLSEIGRAAVVQSVSCMDAYLHDVPEERLPLVLGGHRPPSAGLNDLIGERVKAAEILGVVRSAGPAQALARAVSAKYDNLALQSETRFQEVLEILGVVDPWTKIDQKFRKDRQIRELEHIKNRLRAITTRRHQIVHRSDIPRGSTQAQTMRKNEATKTRKFVGRLVDAADKAILEAA